MKLQSGKIFYESDDYAGTLVIFTGSGSVFGSNASVKKSVDLAQATFTPKKSQDDSWTINIKSAEENINIPLADVVLPVTWPDTEAGKENCLKDLRKWANEVKLISGGNITVGGSVSVSNFPDTVKGYNDYDHTKTFDDNGNITTDAYKTKGTSTVVQTVTYTYDANGNNTGIVTT